MNNTGALPQVLQMRQEDQHHHETRFIKRRLFHEATPSAVGVRVTPFDSLGQRRYLPTTGPMIRSANQQSSTHHHHHHQYQQYPNRRYSPTRDEWQRAAFEPPITSTRDLHKRRCIQLHYAYNHSRQQMREMKEDQRQMKTRITELEDQLLRAQSGNRNRSFTDTDSMSSGSTVKARSSSSDLYVVSKDGNETSLLASAVAAVTRQESPEEKEQERKPPAMITIRKGGGVRLFFTDSEALSEDEGDDEDIVEDDENEIEVEDSKSYRKRKPTLTPLTSWEDEHALPLHEEDRAGLDAPLLPPQGTIMDMVSNAVSVAEEAPSMKKQKLVL
jgi:hypothetical protein